MKRRKLKEYKEPVDKWGSPNSAGPVAKPYGSTNTPQISFRKQPKKNKTLPKFAKKSKDLLAGLSAQTTTNLGIQAHSRFSRQSGGRDSLEA